ncbi:unnamed protein product [Lymnaea stagnalis]|uniref:EGF-like domain-containing protein n=1 Tax=Lymnaea stagnalis TaxID=6523 RepID=A0AAV2IBG3_LYMST
MSARFNLVVTVCATILVVTCMGASEQELTLTGPYSQCSRGDLKCDNYGLCKKDGRGYYICACPEGFSGKLCQIVGKPRKCTLKCDNGGVCQINTNGNESCACPDGFVGNLCEEQEDISEICTYFKCYNGGECVTVDEVPICNCPRGFRGLKCEDIDLCEEYICYNGGRCKIENGEATCLCGKRFKGKQCELI